MQKTKRGEEVLCPSWPSAILARLYTIINWQNQRQDHDKLRVFWQSKVRMAQFDKIMELSDLLFSSICQYHKGLITNKWLSPGDE